LAIDWSCDEPGRLPAEGSRLTGPEVEAARKRWAAWRLLEGSGTNISDLLQGQVGKRFIAADVGRIGIEAARRSPARTPSRRPARRVAIAFYSFSCYPMSSMSMESAR
jgi:hypothetical protein